ncbi:MAG: LytTR family DNA-binding domain-containing protein [Rhodanobacteraceae bacterium]
MSGPSPSPIRVLVADDETAARRRLQQFLARETDFSVIGECRNGLEACACIAQLRPDLVFLDVEMPELSGIGVVEKIGAEHMPETIFATAYEHYAVAAFEANAIDYLLKPFDGERFARSAARARQQLRSTQSFSQQAQLIALLAGIEQTRSYPDRLLVKVDESQQLIRTSDIQHISAERNYVRLHTASGTCLMRETMKGILERLDPRVFRRIHRSQIVNLDHVRKILPWFGGDSLVMMKDGSRLTLSRNHRDALEGFR